MLPDWDFNGDSAKRAAFIEWAVAELAVVQHWCALRWMRAGAADMAKHMSGDQSYLAAKIYDAPRITAGQPSKPDDFAALDGVDAALRDMGLLKWIFQQNWPGQKRHPASDPANAAYIAARLHWDADERHSRIAPVSHADLDVLPENVRAFGDRLNARFKKYPGSKGRKVADADIAFIVTVTGNPYTDNS